MDKSLSLLGNIPVLPHWHIRWDVVPSRVVRSITVGKHLINYGKSDMCIPMNLHTVHINIISYNIQRNMYIGRYLVRCNMRTLIHWPLANYVGMNMMIKCRRRRCRHPKSIGTIPMNMMNHYHHYQKNYHYYIHCPKVKNTTTRPGKKTSYHIRNDCIRPIRPVGK